MLKIFLPLIVVALPSFCVAKSSDVDNYFSCNFSTTAFFSPLIQHGLINVKPYAVNNSISYFHPKLFNKFSLFGMYVESFYGYADNQVMFIHNSGNTQTELYGVIVRETISNVQAQLNAAGATSARVYRVDSGRTSVTCLSKN